MKERVALVFEGLGSDRGIAGVFSTVLRAQDYVRTQRKEHRDKGYGYDLIFEIEVHGLDDAEATVEYLPPPEG